MSPGPVTPLLARGSPVPPDRFVRPGAPVKRTLTKSRRRLRLPAPLPPFSLRFGPTFPPVSPEPPAGAAPGDAAAVIHPSPSRPVGTRRPDESLRCRCRSRCRSRALRSQTGRTPVFPPTPRSTGHPRGPASPPAPSTRGHLPGQRSRRRHRRGGEGSGAERGATERGAERAAPARVRARARERRRPPPPPGARLSRERAGGPIKAGTPPRNTLSGPSRYPEG